MTSTHIIHQLITTKEIFLTDGGMETSMLFDEGFDLPLFAAFGLLEHDKGRSALRRYFDRFLALAADARTGFVLDTTTWRAGDHWGAQLDYDAAQMAQINHDAVTFAKSIRDMWSARVDPIVINGVIGPAEDGYAPETLLSADQAQRLHTPQVRSLAAAGADMISALTMTHTGEAIGLTQAAIAADMPVVISYTLETDGTLPSGQSLASAIAETDAATKGAPLYYMINCAHPDHFRSTIDGGDAWLARIGGLRANASRLSHAELDEAETLDNGDPAELAELHLPLTAGLPNLRVVGGCCGTDHRHVGCLSRLLHPNAAHGPA